MTGQAKRKKELREKYAGMNFSQEMQARILDMVRASQGITENHFGDWQNLELSDGRKVVAFVLPSGWWKEKNGRIIFGRHEQDTVIKDEQNAQDSISTAGDEQVQNQ